MTNSRSSSSVNSALRPANVSVSLHRRRVHDLLDGRGLAHLVHRVESAASRARSAAESAASRASSDARAALLASRSLRPTAPSSRLPRSKSRSSVQVARSPLQHANAPATMLAWNMESPMPRIKVTVPDELLKAATARAEELGKNIDELYAEAIERYVDATKSSSAGSVRSRISIRARHRRSSSRSRRSCTSGPTRPPNARTNGATSCTPTRWPTSWSRVVRPPRAQWTEGTAYPAGRGAQGTDLSRGLGNED